MRMKWLLLAALSCLVVNLSFSQSEIVNLNDTTAFITTDKSCYKPGDVVIFNLARRAPGNLRIRYKYLNDQIGDMPLKETSWKWKAPANDYTGYLVELYTTENGKEKIISTIGVDVSSDWKKFPRYGFVSKYPSMSLERIDSVVNNLTRYHINGLQFYDWHYKHHRPLAGTTQNPEKIWKDIGGREINGATIHSYIKAAHEKKMKAMFYNLVYGTFKNAEPDGVSPEWYLYTDVKHNSREKFDLPDPPFASALFLTDPSNADWQQYLTKENRKVYDVYDFDGYHMDQLGNRDKSLYKYNGSQVDLSKTFGPFINGIKKNEPEKSVILNAVNQYGQEGIAKTNVDFLYTEVWAPNEGFDGLAKIILDNDALSNNAKNSALTAYIHFVEGENRKGFYNTPAVLLADAVIFAFGGSHLELGEHLLGAPYFPDDNMKMKDDLKDGLLLYYDFLVAYQNLLRDGGRFNKPALHALGNQIQLNNWPAEMGYVSIVGKEFEKKQVIHLLNFKDASTLEWRDIKQIQKEPVQLHDLKLSLKTDRPIAEIWYASPDINKGSAQKMSFVQAGSQVKFTLPFLKYWDMIVLEYQ